MSFTSTDPVSHKGKTNVWLTPKHIIKALGPFDLDPCAHKGWDIAENHYYEDGLEQTWNGRVFCNPPYGKEIGLWLKKCEQHGNAIALVFVRTDTKWFQKLNFKAINFIEGRIKFLQSDFTTLTNAGTPSMLIAFDMNGISAIKNINGRVLINE